MKKKKKRPTCGNCGKEGHVVRKCKSPKMSFGCIAVLCPIDLNESIKIAGKRILNCCTLKPVNGMERYIRFLLINRRDTISYMDFIRGKYSLSDPNYICELFERMTQSEIERIREYDFDRLWHEMWQTDQNGKNQITEYFLAKNKLETLRKGVTINDEIITLENIIDNCETRYVTPEWGFPKGRRERKERNVDSAIREFNEETNLKSSDYRLIDIDPFKENYTGANGIQYEHVYHLVQLNSKKNFDFDEKNEFQKREIGQVGLFSYTDAKKLIRDYHVEKHKLLDAVFTKVSNLLYDQLKIEK